MSLKNGDFTQRQEEFCRQVPLCNWNGAEAARKAGYSKRSAQQIATRLLSNVVIKERIQKLMDEVNDKLDISVERVKKELALLAFLDIGEAFNEDGTLKEISEMPESVRRAVGGLTVTITRNKKENTEYETKNVKIIDKVKPLELLGKELGMFVERTMDMTPIVSDEDLDARIEAEKNRK